jgi:6-phosphofructo-2-kinase/fructose-2,6-biphosphatase 2
MYRQEGKKKSQDEIPINGPIRNSARMAQRAMSLHAMPTSNGDSSPHTNGAGRQRNSESEDERQRLHCKNAIHLAVPMAKKYYSGDKASSTSTPHVIAMVGLPARGKTYISKKLSRYLNWIGVNTKVFNLGDYRRRMETKYSNHEVFNPENAEGRALREKVCEDGLQDVLDWLEKSEGEVAVFDATNTTRERRKYLYQRVVLEKGFKLFFVESICDDPKIIEANILEVKVTSPDYKHFDKEKILHDFLERIGHYEKLYETIDENLEPDLAYLKIFDTGRKVMIHKHEGHIQSRIVYYLMNVHITPRTIYLTRHGESFNNVIGRLGGDSELTPRGDEFAKKLGEYINELKHPNFKVWTSWLR